jgi:hypothetical protein
MDRESTIRKIFTDEKIQFIIPPYQRAFSWGTKKDSEKDKQVIQFIEDLKDQKKKYFFGHFLFEKNKEDENKFLVIDGQQRLTTIVIFFSCLLKIINEKIKNGETYLDKDNEPIDFKRVEENFLQFGKRRKFKTVEYDDNYFENLVIKHNQEVIANTDSKHKIHDAYFYFMKVMSNESSKEILRWKEIIEDAVITTFEVSDKVQATQIFGFQNDRGKDLTNLEKLKAFLMYQVYLSSDDTNSVDAIKYVEREFSEIYEMTERIEKLDEDQVLNHYSIGFLKGWESPLENIKKELTESTDKEQWIKEFCTNLKNTFSNVERIEKRANENSFVGDVLILDAYNSWALLLKIYHFHLKQNGSNEIEKYETVFRLMEKTLFKLNYSFGDYRTNDFHSYAKQYTGNIEELKEKLVEASNKGFKWYWAFNDNFVNYLKGKNHYNATTRYLLWKYENHLRKEKKVAPMSGSEYLNKFGARNLDNTLEHITPQNPDFTNYSETFVNEWLNNLGNLVLMTLGKNAQLNNAKPIDKADGFQNSTLLSQKEVGDKIKSKEKWNEEEINERQEKILSFALNYWNN